MWPNKKPNRARPVMATSTFLPIDEFQMRVNQFTSLLLDGCPHACLCKPDAGYSMTGNDEQKKRCVRSRHPRRSTSHRRFLTHYRCRQNAVRAPMGQAHKGEIYKKKTWRRPSAPTLHI